jgi:hypothetical protein
MCVITAAVILQNLFLRDFLMMPLKSFPLAFLVVAFSFPCERWDGIRQLPSGFKLCTVHFLAMIQHYKSPHPPSP